MKEVLGWIVLGVLASPSIFADGSPLLTKSYEAGMVPPSMAQGLMCEVYADRVVIRKSSGALSVTTTTQIELQGDIRGEIAKAAGGHVTNLPAPTDGPVTMWLANSGDGASSSVELKAEGSERISNDSPSAATLIRLLDQLCQ